MCLLWSPQNTLGSRNGALAIWVQCGHEIRIEARKQIVSLLSAIANPTDALIKAGLIAPPAPPEAASKADAVGRSRQRTDVSRATRVSVAGNTAVGTLKSAPPTLPPSIHKPSNAAVVVATSPQHSVAPATAADTAIAPRPQPAAGTVDTLLAQQASVEAAFKASVEDQKRKQAEFERERAEKLAKVQADRRAKWEREDQQRLEVLRQSMNARQEQRHEETNQLLAYLQRVDAVVERKQQSASLRVDTTGAKASRPATPSKTAHTTPKGSPKPSPKARSPKRASPVQQLSYDEVLEKLKTAEEEDKRLPLMRYRQYQQIQAGIEKRLMQPSESLVDDADVVDDAGYNLAKPKIITPEMLSKSATKIQTAARGKLARKRVSRLKWAKDRSQYEHDASTKIQTAIRGRQARKQVEALRAERYESLLSNASAVNIQRLFRGHVARQTVHAARREAAVVAIQRVARGKQARISVNAKRAEVRTRIARHTAATKIQSAYRMHATYQGFKQLQFLNVSV